MIGYAQSRGWKVAHFRPGMTKRGRWVTAVQGDGKGFPDLILVRGDRIIAAELKVGKGKCTTEQDEWLTAFAIALIESCVWHPDRWETIKEILE